MAIEASAGFHVGGIDEEKGVGVVRVMPAYSKSVPMNKRDPLPNMVNSQNTTSQRRWIPSRANPLAILPVPHKTGPIRQNAAPIHPILDNRGKRPRPQRRIRGSNRPPRIFHRHLKRQNAINQPARVPTQDYLPHRRHIVIQLHQDQMVHQILKNRRQPDYSPTGKHVKQHLPLAAAGLQPQARRRDKPRLAAGIAKRAAQRYGSNIHTLLRFRFRCICFG